MPNQTDYFELVQTQLRRVAGAAMRRERSDHTLQPTALVNEAYLRLNRSGQPDWANRGHFYSAAVRAMREILVDHARVHCAGKRGGTTAVKVELTGNVPCHETNSELLLAVHTAVDKLREIDPRAAQVVELRYFSGLSVEEAADVMDVSPKTVKRDWEFARVWLLQQLGPVQGRHTSAK